MNVIKRNEKPNRNLNFKFRAATVIDLKKAETFRQVVFIFLSVSYFYVILK